MYTIYKFFKLKIKIYKYVIYLLYFYIFLIHLMKLLNGVSIYYPCFILLKSGTLNI